MSKKKNENSNKTEGRGIPDKKRTKLQNPTDDRNKNDKCELEEGEIPPTTIQKGHSSALLNANIEEMNEINEYCKPR